MLKVLKDNLPSMFLLPAIPKGNVKNNIIIENAHVIIIIINFYESTHFSPYCGKQEFLVLVACLQLFSVASVSPLLTVLRQECPVRSAAGQNQTPSCIAPTITS